MNHLSIVTILIALFSSFSTFSQVPDSIRFDFKGEHEYSWTYSAYTALFDLQGRPYLYTANSELGIVVFDISDVTQPVPVDTLLPAAFGGLKPTHLWLDSTHLYASLGGFQGLIPQNAGIVLLDIQTPSQLTIVSQWDSAAFRQGAAIVQVVDDYAYIGAMEEGLLIVDISDKSAPRFVSQVVPNPNFPRVPGIFSKPNARGMAIDGDVLWLCYDAGGLRAIDISDKKNPIEVAQYINGAMDSLTQSAYNNAVAVGDYLYIAIDYCGLEVVNIQRADSPYTVAWYNPWDCMPSTWSGSPGHTNQLVVSSDGKLLFMSGGDSEVLAFDISTPTSITPIGALAHVGDSLVTWGMDMRGHQLALACVDVSGVFIPNVSPYYSDYGGIQLYEWQELTTALAPAVTPFSLSLSPNPFSQTATLHLTLAASATIQIDIYDASGRHLTSRNAAQLREGNHEISLPMAPLSSGLYLIQVQVGEEIKWLKGMKR